MYKETQFFDKANKLKPINTVSVSREELYNLSRLEPETCFKEYRRITEERGLSYDTKYDIATHVTKKGITLANIPFRSLQPIPTKK